MHAICAGHNLSASPLGMQTVGLLVHNCPQSPVVIRQFVRCENLPHLGCSSSRRHTVKAMSKSALVSRNQNRQSTAAAAVKHTSHAAVASDTSRKTAARQVAEEFYARYNKGDIEGLMDLFAEDCEYHDMIYAEPFHGKAETQAFFAKCSKLLSKDLQFVIDNMSDNDPYTTGVKWHLELNGEEFPFSRGLSFYELNEDGKIVSARDIPEPAFKPGDAAFYVIKAITPLIRKLGPKANPGNLKHIPKAAIAGWAFYVGYIGLVLFSSVLPGKPAYAVEWRTLVETWHCSVNFFYVNQIFNWLGINFIKSSPENPVYEALFNLVNVWSLMLWPLMLADPKGVKVKNKAAIYGGTQFLTNIFFVPYMALRQQPAGSKGTTDKPGKSELPAYAPAIGWTGAVIGIGSVIWALAVRPEYGGLAERWQYAVQQTLDNRVFFAFVLDAVMYAAWQAILMDKRAPKSQRFVPFVGLVSYLVKGGRP